jgi:hypothetical protein
MLLFESIEARWESSVVKFQIQAARAKIPGGWLVGNGQTVLCFVPDPEHRWDGSSLPDTKGTKQSPNVAGECLVPNA